MNKELNEELKRGVDTAKALVAHVENMGRASMAEIPVSHVDSAGNLQEWKVTVELIHTIKMQ